MAIFQEINGISVKSLSDFKADNAILSNVNKNALAMRIRDKRIFEDFNNEQAKDVKEFHSNPDTSILYLDEDARYREDMFRRYWMTGEIVHVNETWGRNINLSSPFSSEGSVTHKCKKLKWLPLLYTDVKSVGFPNPIALGAPLKDLVYSYHLTKATEIVSSDIIRYLINDDYTMTLLTLQEYTDRFKDMYILNQEVRAYSNTYDGSYSKTYKRKEYDLYPPVLILKTKLDSVRDIKNDILEQDVDSYMHVAFKSLMFTVSTVGNYNEPFSCLSSNYIGPYSTEIGHPVLTPLMSTRRWFSGTVKSVGPRPGGGEGARSNLYFHVGTRQQFKDFFNAMGLKITDNATEAEEVNTKSWAFPPNISPIIPDPIIPDPPPIPPQPDQPGSVVPGSGGQQGGQTGGGSGTGDTIGNVSEPIRDGSTRTGTSELSTSYAMTYAEVEELQKSFLQPTLWTNLSGYFKDEQSGLINLLRFPFDITSIDGANLTEAKPIQVVGVPMTWAGGQVDGLKMGTNMLTRLNLGKLEFKEYFGTFLDYDPYTKINLYLPYFGYKTLSANAVMNKTVELLYNISYLDGSCMVIVKADGVPIHTIEGRIGYQVPLAKGDINNIIQSAIKTGIGALAIAGAGMATGGVGAVATAGGMSTTTMLTNSAKAGALGSTAVNTVGSLLQKSTASVTGTTQGVHARAMSNIPFVIIERPITNMPLNYSQIAGFQTNLYDTLSTCKGMTVCEHVKLDGFGYATESEKDEIKMLLSRGVIL